MQASVNESGSIAVVADKSGALTPSDVNSDDGSSTHSCESNSRFHDLKQQIKRMQAEIEAMRAAAQGAPQTEKAEAPAEARPARVTSSMFLLRLEDSFHIWVKEDGSPVLMRVRLVDRLTRLQIRHLSLASPFEPIRVDVEVGAWNGTSFWGALGDIHCPVAVKAVGRRRRKYAMPM